MKVFIFGKVGCARCESTKRKVSHLLDKWGVTKSVEMSFVNMDTVEGLAEGSFYDVSNIPVTIVRSGQEEVLARWDEIVPETEELRDTLEVASVAAGDQGTAGNESD